MSRLKTKYESEIVPILAKEFEIKNKMAIPKVEKIVLNMGLGESRQGINCRIRFKGGDAGGTLGYLKGRADV